MAVSVAVGPLVVPAPGNVLEQRVVAGRRASRITGWAVHRDGELADGREGDAERVSESVGPDRVGGAERVVRGDRAVGVVAQDLAARVAHVLSARGVVLVAKGHVELAVRAEGEAPTLVAAVPSGGEGGDDRGVQPGAVAVVPADDVLCLPVGVGVEGVDEPVGREGRADGEAEEPALAVAPVRLGGDGADPGERLGGPVLPDAYGARPLGPEEPAVRGEGQGGGEGCGDRPVGGRFVGRRDARVGRRRRGRGLEAGPRSGVALGLGLGCGVEPQAAMSSTTDVRATR